MNKQKEHDEAVEQLKETLGQKGNKDIIGWSVQDCLDNPNTSPLMQKILILRDSLKKNVR